MSFGDDEIILVDQFTGRKMAGREFSDGLHQAIQAKEKCWYQARDNYARNDYISELLPFI